MSPDFILGQDWSGCEYDIEYINWYGGYQCRGIYINKNGIVNIYDISDGANKMDRLRPVGQIDMVYPWGTIVPYSTVYKNRDINKDGTVIYYICKGKKRLPFYSKGGVMGGCDKGLMMKLDTQLQFLDMEKVFNGIETLIHI